MYRDKQGVEYPYVHLLPEKQEGYPPDWHFHDETEDLHGPFGSLEDTFARLNEYVRWLNGDACGTASSHRKRKPSATRYPKERRRK